MAITALTLWKIRNGANLYSSASQHGLKRLRNIVVEAAVPPTLCGVLNFIFVLALYHKSMIPVCLVLVAPPFYVWSMMFTLNSRPAIRQAFNPPRDADEDQTLSTNFQFAEFQPPKGESSEAETQVATTDLRSIPNVPRLTRLSVNYAKESNGGVPTTGDTRDSKNRYSKDHMDLV
ncbi:hypothetical protein FRB90_010814 [Tulasnella sp. 427]|nr:hypothetical protein FRB90_010814 [Tulasnella sp. 427]